MKKSTGGKKYGKLSNQFLILITITTAIIVAVMVIISGVVTVNNVNQELIDQCVTGTNLLEHELGLQSVIEMEDKTDVLDRLKDATGCEFTYFEGDVRASTTIIVNNERVVGTKLDSEIANLVLNRGQSYIGNATILGEEHFTSYIPHYDETGEITGVVFAGIATSENDKSIVSALSVSAGVGILMIIIICIISKMMISKSVEQPLAIVMNSAQKITKGEMHFDSIDVSVNNEIGQLADSFNEMKSVVSKLNEILVNMLGKIAKGDWNVDIGEPEDYVGDWRKLYVSVDEMTYSVRNALSQVSSSAIQISTGVSSVSSNAQVLAEGAIDQAGNVDMLSRNLQEISVQIEDNTANTRKVNELALVSGEVTKSTLSDMNKLYDAMMDISNTSENISKVIKVIDEIAFQTNILALNAAVEAARAGSAGKGFAVVADEVRNLAQKSSEAAKSTSELIQHSIGAVAVGEEIAKKTNASFEELVERVNKMVQTIEEITKATEEQAEGIRNVTIGIEQISMVIQTNSSMSEESAAASQELSALADTLHMLVDKFKL